MRAVRCKQWGGPEVMEMGHVEDPTPGGEEVIVDVVATAVNRADVRQREGHYQPPEGASSILGLEVSGRISELGGYVTDWQIGDSVCALLSGGGYAERVAVPVGQLMPVPVGVDLVSAASLPEAACTTWSVLSRASVLRDGVSVLVHGGSSGIGTFAIQLLKAHGANVLCTASTEHKISACRSLGADVAIDYRSTDFVTAVMEATGGRGVDAVLDIIGGPYLARNLEALAPGGVLIALGVQGGSEAPLDMRKLLIRDLMIQGSTLRAKSLDAKRSIVSGTIADVWPLISDGSIRTVIDDVMPWERMREAHDRVESSQHVGKVVLLVD